MRYVLGIDGGGTKTDFLLCGEDLKPAGQARTGPCRRLHQDNLIDMEVFAQGVHAVIREARASLEDVQAACFGMPGYGEFPKEDVQACEQLRERFPGIRFHIANDAEIGWAGALALSPGIIVISGTGSIAYGRNSNGDGARCGGWWSNEGSGYWLGNRAVELFLKQLDGRMQKSALYGILMEALQLERQEDFFPYSAKNLRGNRENLAAIQLLLEKAARGGDENALAAYKEAGEELALLAKGCQSQLKLPPPVKVSYAGSIFNAGAKLIGAFFSALKQDGFEVCAPLHGPVMGAVLLALDAQHQAASSLKG